MDSQFSYKIIADVDKASFTQATQEMLKLYATLEAARREKFIAKDTDGVLNLDRDIKQLKEFTQV
jgi:hypothetical protein